MGFCQTVRAFMGCTRELRNEEQDSHDLIEKGEGAAVIPMAIPVGDLPVSDNIMLTVQNSQLREKLTVLYKKACQEHAKILGSVDEARLLETLVAVVTKLARTNEKTIIDRLIVHLEDINSTTVRKDASLDSLHYFNLFLMGINIKSD